MDRNTVIAILLAIIGFAMIIAGVIALRSNTEEQAEVQVTNRSKKASAPKKESNMLANWLFGGHRGMEAIKEARLRIKIGVFLVIVAAFITLASYLQ